MATWSKHDPGVCNVGQLEGALQTMNTMIVKLNAIHTNVNANIAAVTADAWSGTAVEAWRTGGNSVSMQVDAFHDALKAVHAATTTYRANIVALQNSAEIWKTELQEANWVLNTPYMLPQYPTQDQIDDAKKLHDAASDKKAEALRALETLASQRESYDTAYISAIRLALPSNWEQQRTALAAVGLDTVGEFANPVEVRRVMVDLATTIAESDLNDENAQEIAALYALFDLYGDDAGFMSSFYLQLGGAKTVQLVEAFGDKVLMDNIGHELANYLGQRIRHGLSISSTNWTKNQGEDFATSMFEADRYAWSSIGYLFNDPSSPLGEQLAISAAIIVDDIEQAGGTVYGFNSVMGGNALSFLEYPEGSEEYMRVQDPSGPIFSTLGGYPDAAFDFLTDPEKGADRVQYWFEDRLGFEADKFQGVADLWLGAETAEPHGSMTAEEFVKQSAELTSLAFNAIMDHDYFLPENISNSATAALGGVFLVNIEAFTEYPINAPANLKGEGSAVERELANDEKYWSPGVTDVDMAAFLARAGSHPAGSEIILHGVGAYQQILLGIADQSGDPARMLEAFNKVVSLQAAVDGANMGSVIDEGVRSDARTEQIMDTVRDAVGLIPVKGASELLVDGGIWLFDVAQDKLIDGLLEYDTNAWARQAEFAIDSMYAGKEQREDMARFSIAENLYSMYKGDLPGETNGAPPTLDVNPNDSASEAAERLAIYKAEADAWLNDPKNMAAVSVALAETAGPTASLDTLAGEYEEKYAQFSGYVRDYDSINN